MKALKWCANGCGVPPEAPSKVICKKCQQEITKGLQALVDRLETTNPKEFKDVVADTPPKETDNER